MADQIQLDREWYTSDEHQNHLLVGDDERSYASYRQRKIKQLPVKRQTDRQQQWSKDQDLWERNRLQRSQLLLTGGVDQDIDDDDQNVAHVILSKLSPPFLNGQIYDSVQTVKIEVVKDPTSDMAVVARKGSALVASYREKREQINAAQKQLRLAGSTMGNVLGVQAEFLNDQPKHIPKVFTTQVITEEQRQSLPIYQCRQQLMQVIRDNQVVVIVGETGSGKSTQLTQYLHEDGYSKYGMIGCTQPRRVAAMAVAKRVSHEMNVRLGQEVGYSIRFEDVTSDKTVIKYCTDGVLLRESLRDPEVDSYSCIIMDEAHERSLNTDVLLGLLKKVVSQRRDLKLIVTSATMDASRFSRFFGYAPIYRIAGRTYPVEVLFSRTTSEDYVDAAVKQALSIHFGPQPGDILIFMTGQEDIDVTCQVMKEKLSEMQKDIPSIPSLTILPIYSQMPADLQAKIFEADGKMRKCIVATNIAETSLTLDGVVYVIDSGYCKLKVYNSKIGMDSLQITPISQANASQRSGRAGRTGPGFAYRLYSENAYNHYMYNTTVPEIQRINLANVVLLLKSLNVGNVLDFDFLDRPSLENILHSMYLVWVLGALDDYGNLTSLGKRMVQYPLEPSLSKLLIMSEELKCTEEVLTIVSMLSVPTVFYRPKGREIESDARRESFQVPESDHLSLLNVYNQWMSAGCRDHWCTEKFLHSKSLYKARDVRTQLMEIVQKSNMTVVSCGMNLDVVRRCICSAFFHNAAKKKNMGEYISLQTALPCYLHPTASLYGLGNSPDYVVYHELILTSKEYMICVTAVDSYWLADYGSRMYNLTQSRFGQKREYASQVPAPKPVKLIKTEQQPASKSKSKIVEVGAFKSRKNRQKREH